MMGSGSGHVSGSGSMSLMGCEVNLNESVHEGGNGENDKWQLSGGEMEGGGGGGGSGGGGIGGDDDCFGWPDLAISAPGTSLK